ncbi:MAG: hypothetical protein ABIO67_06120, partial [Mycobacteriales bacterium]
PTATPTATPTPTPTAGTGITTVGATTDGSAATTQVRLTKPAGTAAGDLLVASFSADLTPDVTAPSGWTSFVPVLRPGYNNVSLFGYYRVATSADAGTTNWTWTLSASVKWNGGMSAYRGVDASTPFDTAVSTGLTHDFGATSVTVPGVTTTRAGSMIIGGYGADGAAVTVEPPTGFTEVWESAGQQIAEQANRLQSALGATGDQSWTLNEGRAQAAWLVALRPA